MVQAKPAFPPGPLHIVISIDAQRASLFAGGALVRQSSISSGTPEYPTPMGVFSVLQKNRHHVSNIYHVPMPFMQRITWSGIALHQGPLPGYPASHGCIRLPLDFAELLWKTTKIGARVIVTRPEVAPAEIAHARLFAPKVVPETPVADQRAEAVLVKTADWSTLVTHAVAHDAGDITGTINARAIPASSDMKAAVGSFNGAKPPDAAIPNGKDVARRTGAVSVFVSRKDGRLYVRHATEPLFDTPVTILEPHRPLGTHVFTAMEVTNGGAGMRWTAVSIPSSYPREWQSSTRSERYDRKRRDDRSVKAVAYQPPVAASAALDRIEIPPEAIERIAELLTPGSSLIISDNGISNETGRGTDFIVLTR